MLKRFILIFAGCSQQLHLAMECTKVLFFFLLQCTADFSTEENSIFSRSSYLKFEKISSLRYTLSNCLILPVCLLLCMENAWCSSTNYKMSSKKDGKGTCELGTNTTSLSSVKTCTYIISRESFFRCY